MTQEKTVLLKTIEPLLILEGEWNGFGKGFFSTMADFKYREELCFKALTNEPYIQLEQKAWMIYDNHEKLIHLETGIISAVAENRLKFYTCHMNGRIEIANVTYMKDTLKHKLVFKSDFIKNNSSLKTAINSVREFVFDEKCLNYNMSMSTSDVVALDKHLNAKLLKVN